jgi:putative NADH-flavin reductase
MNVLILGAAGATGRLCVDEALARSHRVAAFVHKADLQRTDERLEVVTGDLRNQVDIENALKGKDAVVSTFAGSTPTRRFLDLVEAFSLLVRQMEAQGPKRLVYLSFLGMPEGRSQLSWLGRNIVSRFVLHNVAADHEAKEAILKRSSLDWVIVRPPRLTNGPATGRYRYGEDILAEAVVPTISRADLAGFLIDQIESERFVRKTPAIMY